MRIRSDKTIATLNNGIAQRSPFRAASISGEFLAHVPWGTWLSEDEAAQLSADIAASSDRRAFVVSSYATPVAWCLPNGSWYVTDTKYSPSTTHHTNLIREAIRLASES